MNPFVTLECTSHFHQRENHDHWLKFEIKLYKDVTLPIGSAELLWINATCHSPAELRERADSWEFHLYQTLSSVRIYPDQDKAEWDRQMGFIQHDSSIFIPYQPNDSFLKRGQYENKTFKKKTATVWGKLVLLRSFHIDEEYQRQGYGLESMKQIISFFNQMGADFFLLKPFPSERDRYIDHDTQLVSLRKLKKEIRGLVHFYQKLGFAETIGRSDELSMYCSLQPKEKQNDWLRYKVSSELQYRPSQTWFENRNGYAS